jgi:ABC-2 type transport system permease protein
MNVGAMAEASMSAEDAPGGIPALRRFSWSVRREIWENRSIYLAQLAVAGVFLVGFFIALVRLPERIRAAAMGPAQLQEVIEQPYVILAIMLMAVYLLVAVFYCLDALYGERRDRSILFWKSMPVSDLTTVLSKASIPILVLPLVTFAVTVVASFVMLLVSSVVLAGAGLSATTPWTRVPFFEVSVTNFLHVVVFHGIWYAPFYGWLLLASAWAKRAPLLWAALPPVAIGVLERIAFNTSHFAGMVQYRFMGSMESGEPADRMTMDMLAPPEQFLIGPGMWVGLAITAGFLFVAARLHRFRGPV